MKTPILIQAQNLRMQFDQQIVFQEVSFQIRQGDFFCIVGPNGSGKTTLIRLILGQMQPTVGQITRHLALDQMGYMPQFRNIATDYPLSTQAFVALKLIHNWQPWLTKTEKEQVATALQATRIWDKRKARLGRMSGGEKQRVYLAQAIVNQPQLLILDEPTASLDVYAKFQVMDVVQELNRAQTTVVFISHDPDLLAHYGTQQLDLTGGTK